MKLIRKTSKSLICAMCLVAINLSWASDWVSVGMSDAAVYGIDRSSVEKEGHVRRVWSMLDYRQPQKNSLGKTFLSSRMLLEIDCQQKLGRSRSLAIYSGAHLSGEMLTSEGVIADWQPVPQSSPVFTIMRHVCEN
jgi:hypothetical protein